jgi:hypothetical protein
MIMRINEIIFLILVNIIDILYYAYVKFLIKFQEFLFNTYVY